MHGLVLSDNVFFFLWQAPLSCNIFSLDRPFCAVNPPSSDSFHNLLYSFLVVLLFFVLRSSDPAVFKELNSLQHFGVTLGPACNNSSILVTFSVSQSPSIFRTKSELHPACPFFLPYRGLPNVAFPIFAKLLTSTWALCIFLAFSCPYCLFHISYIDTC